MSSSLKLTKTKAKKSLIVSFGKENKSILKQLKKNCENVVLTKSKSEDKEKSKYLLEFQNPQQAKKAKLELEEKLGKDLVQIEYPFAKLKKEAIEAKKQENKENSSDNHRKPEKAFEIKLPKLILRNLSFKMTEDSLRKEMEKYGKIVLTSLPVKDDGKLKGFGFVQFSTLDEAKKALEDLNSSNKKLAGNKVIVDWCIPKNIFQRLETQSKTQDPPKQGNDDNATNEDDEASEQGDSDAHSEEEDDEDEEPENKKKLKKDDDKRFDLKAKSGTKDVVEKRTVFLRNLSFDATEEAVAEAFSRFGPVKYVKLCIDRELERPKGTGFIQFETSEAATAACSESNVFELDFRKIQIDMAVSRNQVNEMVKNKKDEENMPKDKRNMALAKEGIIYPNSYEAEGVSKADMIKRQKIEASNAQKLKLLHFFVSPTRLSVHNIPIKCSDQQLREIFQRAVGEPVGDNRKASSITECRIMRDLTRVNSEGVAKSKGYGFVEFKNHEMAMKALHATNNNPKVFDGSNTRLIVQFSIEDMRALKKKTQRLEKANKRNTIVRSK